MRSEGRRRGGSGPGGMVGWLGRRYGDARAVCRVAGEVRRIRRHGVTGHPPRILHLIESVGPGGAERVLVDIARQLGPDYQSTIGLLRHGWLETLAVSSGVPAAMVGADSDMGVMARLVEAVRAHQIGLIQTHEFYMSVLGASVSRLTGIPLVVTVHGRHYYPEKRRRRAMYRIVAAWAAALITVSEDLQRFFCRTTGVPASRVQVIHNGIDLARVCEATRNPALLEASGIPSSARIIGTIGNLYAVKGHVHLIRALRRVLPDHPDTHLVILGRGELKDELRAEAHGLGIGGRVHLLGYCDEVAKWLAVMDVFVLSSLSEGLPLALLEAMAAGKPAVVTAVGGMPEVVRDGETGFVVPAADPDALARRIAVLLERTALAKEMGTAGQRRVHESFSLDRTVTEYRHLYRRTLDSMRKSGN